METRKVYLLADLIKAVEIEQSDAEWDGDVSRALGLKRIATRYRERIENGEEWEPSF